VIVIERAVMAAVLLICTPSSSKKAWLELITGVTVTPPVPPAVVTVRAIVVVWLRLPLVPVTVTVAVPVAVLDAVKVRVLVPVVDAGLKLAVTPVGRPLALSATDPVNPFDGVTMMVLLLLAPCVTDRLAGDADKEKLA
jgi:hypothetical protein